MNFGWGFLIGIVIGMGIGAGVCLVWLKSKKTENVVKEDVTELAHQKHVEMMAKLKAYIVGKTEVSNDEVQSFLGVSDASAERYLAELESAGVLTQLGTVGQKVKYKIL